MFAFIIHPENGKVIFDTGYHPRFHEATRPFPESIYSRTTPCYIMLRANPHWLGSLLYDDNKAVQQTLNSLRRLFAVVSDSVDFVPTHCERTVNEISQKGWMT